MTQGMMPTADEVAATLRLGRSTTYQLIATGELLVVRIGRAIRVPRAALEVWVRRRTTPGKVDRQTDGSITDE